MMDVSSTYCGNQTILLYALNLLTYVNYFLIKRGDKKNLMFFLVFKKHENYNGTLEKNLLMRLAREFFLSNKKTFEKVLPTPLQPDIGI